jgi:prepilin-type N-terminal cleavage/methylation domain-containing protein/prepilin-type processing-associated H-X9-DG protein
MASDTRFARRGFTLIEVLVVVAIIALLISILLPSLATARELARQTACGSQLSHLGKAENTYATSNQDWIPGSPLTTGHYFAANASIYWAPTLKPKPGDRTPRYNRFASSWYDYTGTLKMTMFGASNVPAPSAANPHVARAKMFKDGTEGIFQCPSNNQVAAPYSGGTINSAEYKTIRAPSYLTMDTMMRGGPDIYNSVASRYPGAAGKPSDIACAPSGWDITLPSDYVPRHTKIGRESMKVFLADGTRYVDETYLTSGKGITYNIEYRGPKLAWSATPPSTAETATSVHGREYTYAKEHSYRHGIKDKINAVFFDGHVETLQVMGHRIAAVPKPAPDGLIGARFYGSAVHPKYYYPSNSTVNIPQEIFHPNTGQMFVAGSKLP